MTGSRTDSRTRGPVTRVFLWICGGIATFVAAFWAVTATADLALSAGVYGTPGTYKVESCHDTNPRRKYSDISCYGDFRPDGGMADDAVYVHLKGTGHDYPDGTEFDARQGLEPQTIQRAGIRGVVGELWQVAFAVAALGWLAYLVIRPPKSDKPNRSREPSGREKAAEQVGGGVLVCVAVGVLGWVANLVESITSN
ncbi:hypothetical protein E0500_018860 [Streptomyces sp. KM273126]|uniref:hypothetical protein n=1 Tax=Streptomyces sp. KM273126 TaxID=2545247 RepID=UPI00103A1DBC|nr:hypothetical protein [Streptomyces sp. KM273126]MBA2809402.1 hypothetical protein [Streptomyces sp. KM273126]